MFTFLLKGVIPEQWLIPIQSAYHPLLITGLSLVVCYWSEVGNVNVFHF